jgi:hypothetical protein
MNTSKIKNLFSRSLAIVVIVLLGGLLPGATPAFAAGTGNVYVIAAGSHGGSTYLYSDSVGGTKLATGSLLQFIYAGADGLVSPPDANGNPTGDDQLIQTGTIGTPWPTAAGEFFYFLDNLTDYAKIYVRAWNASSAAAATKYGNSELFTLNGGTPKPTPLTWNVISFATTTNKPGNVTLVSIAVTPANPSISLGTTQQFTATGTYSDGSTPNITNSVAWTSSNTATATINGTSGLATAVAAGTTQITASLNGKSGSTNLTVTNTPPAPLQIISTSPLPNGTVGVPYSQPLQATGGTQPYTWSLIGGTSLPAGLFLNASTGVISGTPTTAQTTNTLIKVADSASPANSTSKLFALTINTAPIPALLSINPTNSTQGQTLNVTLTGSNTNWSGDMRTAVQFSNTSIIVNSAAASDATHISANIMIPAGAPTGVCFVTVTGASGTPYFTVNPASTLTINTTSLPNGTVNSAYSYTLSASGGTTPYTWSIISGALPAGLSLNSSTGIISGTPTTVQTANFTVQVSGGGTATRDFSIVVNPVGTLTITTASLPGGTVNSAYSQPVNATGGTQPYTWSISAGSLPAGLSINSSTGVISGTPTTAQTANFTVQVSGGGTATRDFSIVVNPAGVVTLVSIAVTPVNPTINIGATQQFTATGTYSDSSTSNITSQVSWTSGTPARATINNAGLATGLTAGTTVISASVGVIGGSTTLTVQQGGGNGPAISGIAPATAFLGQTIVITGSNFGAAQGASTLTIGGVTAIPTFWSASSITVAVPTGVASGTAAVAVTVGSQTGNGNLTVDTRKVFIDDFDGGDVSNFTVVSYSGYYIFDKFSAYSTKETTSYPDQAIDSTNPQAGAHDMQVLYSYGNRTSDPHYAGATKDWGGGWGGLLVNTLDLTGMNYVNFYVQWDGSSNDMKIGLKDANGAENYVTVPNATVRGFTNGYGVVSVAKSSFPSTSFAWNAVQSYNFVYPTKFTSTAPQYIDSFSASVTPEGNTNPTPTGEVVITAINPSSAPTGAKIIVSGHGFGLAQGPSSLLFNNAGNNVAYPAQIISWNDTEIEAIVPQTAPIGGYNVVVNRLSIVSGVVTALQSNPAAFQVTNSGVETAHIYPNPFDPNHEVVNIVFTQPSGAANLGVYIYDMTARRVAKQMISSGQTTWDGKELNTGTVVADGAYLLRVINEDTKTLIAKGKILVVKR